MSQFSEYNAGNDWVETEENKSMENRKRMNEIKKKWETQNYCAETKRQYHYTEVRLVKISLRIHPRNFQSRQPNH